MAASPDERRTSLAAPCAGSLSDAAPHGRGRRAPFSPTKPPPATPGSRLPRRSLLPVPTPWRASENAPAPSPKRAPATASAASPLPKRASSAASPARAAACSPARVLGESQRDNLNASLPRHKPADEVARLAEARLAELRHEKHELVNEREDLRTELRTLHTPHSNTDLGRQRELKLKTTVRTCAPLIQIEKQDAMITRYKERAAAYSRSQQKQTSAAEALYAAQADATHLAAQCAALEHELGILEEQAVRWHLRNLTQDAGALNDEATANCLASVTYIAAQALRDAETHRVAIAALQAQLRDATAERNALRSSVYEQRITIAELDEHAAALRHQRDELAAELDARRPDAHFLVDRCAWLESCLAFTHAERADALDALRDAETQRRTALQAEADAAAELRTQLADLQRQADALSADNTKYVRRCAILTCSLESQLEHVAWYCDAYAIRTQQAELLSELCALADRRAEDARARTSHENTEALDTRIYLLRKSQWALKQRRDDLASHAQTLEQHLEFHNTAQMAPRNVRRCRRNSDSAIYA